MMPSGKTSSNSKNRNRPNGSSHGDAYNKTFNKYGYAHNNRVTGGGQKPALKAGKVYGANVAYRRFAISSVQVIMPCHG